MTKSGSGAESSNEEREELAAVAASLRAYLEWQQDTGATGIPRKPRSAAAATPSASSSAPAPPSPPVPSSPTATATASPAATATATASPTATSSPPVRPLDPAFARGHVAAAATSPAAPTTAPAPRPGPAAAPAAPAPPAPRAARRPLEVIAAEAATCTKCGLAATRTNVVFSRGSPDARLCFVGEAPGADEDAQGVPFVGRAGQLLDKMIVAMGLDPEKDVYVCNIIKCRPPANRRPEPVEIETCIPYLHEQLTAIDPKVVVALGNTAVAALLGSKLGISKVRGQWKLYRGKYPVMPTYHPSYLLRPSAQQVEAKKQVWDDLQAVMKELGLPLKKP